MSRVLAFGCTHSPFMKKGYVAFLKGIYKRYKCDRAVHLGDEVDHHRISFHDPEPEAMGAREELQQARKELKALFQAFPKLSLCLSNHTSRHTRRGASVGIPEDYFKSLGELLGAPPGWQWAQSWEIDGVIYEHGEGYSGVTGHLTAVRKRMKSIVIGHLHSVAGVEYIATEDQRVFGMCVGCGIDHKSYAFKYGKNLISKPIIACGVVVDGSEATVVPMSLGKRGGLTECFSPLRGRRLPIPKTVPQKPGFLDRLLRAEGRDSGACRRKDGR